MRVLGQINDGLLDFIENTRLGARLFQIGRAMLFGLVIFVAARFVASQFLSLDFRDVLFMAITAVSFLLVYWRREFGIILVVATTAFIMHYDAIPTLSLYHFVPELSWLEPWRLLVGQAILLLLFGLALTSRDLGSMKERAATPLAGAVLLFLLVITATASAGVVFQGVYFPQMVGVSRHYSFYLVFFAVLLSLSSRAQVRTVLNVLLVMAVVMGLLMVAQFALGARVRLFIGEGIRVEALGRFAGRVLPPGQALVWFAVPMLVSVIPLQQGRTRILSLLALGVVSMGLLLTFTRAMWMGTLGGVLLMLFVVHGRERQRILRMFAVFAACVGFLLLILGTVSTDTENYVATYIERFTSTFKIESYVAESTIGVRLEEIREAWPRVVESPWLGIGLGGTYSEVPKWDDLQQSHVWRPRTYIHNAFMLVLTKAGVLGLSSLLAMLGVFFWRANKISRSLRDPTERAVVVGAMGATFACVVGSMLQPSLTRAAPVTLLALMWGVTELFRWFQQRDDREAATSRPQRRVPRTFSDA